MPLFKRHGGDGDSKEPGDAASRILDEREIFERIEEELFRAERYGRPLVILCARPQLLPNEAIRPEEAAVAIEAVSAQLRFSDRVGTLLDGTIVAVLPETPVEVARVIAQRIAVDLTLRSAGVSQRKWLVGASSFPDDGNDPPSIVIAAMQRAQHQQ